ncbi:hypothetical protein LCGC14_1692120 [marine sediment metagenome]|uniref:Uncharacterized protein n=1 Tax=marine sediment metagenome TaxID=412755 RepID=A0A0F9HKX4_9ZZZZ
MAHVSEKLRKHLGDVLGGYCPKCGIEDLRYTLDGHSPTVEYIPRGGAPIDWPKLVVRCACGYEIIRCQPLDSLAQ